MVKTLGKIRVLGITYQNSLMLILHSKHGYQFEFCIFYFG